VWEAEKAQSVIWVTISEEISVFQIG
jgi:hypothetical protein